MVEVEPVEEASEAREVERILVGIVESLSRADVDDPSGAAATGTASGGRGRRDVVTSCSSSSIVDDAGGAAAAAAAVMVELRLPVLLIIPALMDLRNAGGGDREVDRVEDEEEERILSGVGVGAPAHSPATVAVLAALFRRAL